MEKHDITVRIEVAKSREEVFSCITQVAKWWSTDFEGESSRLHDVFTIHHPGQHFSGQQLIDVAPNSKITWLVTDSMLDWLTEDKHEWTDTKMIFALTAEGQKTILEFIHEGLTPEKECFAMCEVGWNMIIKNWLFHFITHGEPSPEMAKAAEIRNRILDGGSPSKSDIEKQNQ